MVVCVLSLPDTRQLDPVPQVSCPRQVIIPELNVEIYVRGVDRIAAGWLFHRDLTEQRKTRFL
jgi:hypothetical protein